MGVSLNFFSPYVDLPPTHENQLTRALLLVLGVSPLVHSAWLRLVDSTLSLEQLPSAVLRSQESTLISSGLGDGDEEPPVRVISVLLAPDARKITRTVEVSDRAQILDGIVEYGRELVIVIENKIVEGLHDRQSVEINTQSQNVALDTVARSVSWQAVLEVIADIVSRDLVSGAERSLLENFLVFAERYFPAVGPYTSLRRAQENPDRVRKRLRTVLARAIGEVAGRQRSDGWYDLPLHPSGAKRSVEMAYLGVDDSGSLCLRLTPADTLEQARVFYARPSNVRELVADARWRTSPNYHWGAIHAGRSWVVSLINAQRYAEFWLSKISKTRSVPRSAWDKYWEELEEAGIVSGDDRAQFDSAFTHTKIQNATPRPGMKVETHWLLADAQVLGLR